jgi:hypothetical protein
VARQPAVGEREADATTRSERRADRVAGVYSAASIATRESFFEPLDVFPTLWEGDETASGYPEGGPLAAEGDLEWQKTQ